MGAKVAMNAAALDTDEHAEVEAGPVRVRAVAVNTPTMLRNLSNIIRGFQTLLSVNSFNKFELPGI